MDTVTYEIDGKEYTVMNRIMFDNTTYLFLMKEYDPETLLLRKINNNKEDELLPLENEDEVKKVLEFYAK